MDKMLCTDNTLEFPTTFQEIQQTQMLYNCAMREICTKIENLSQEFELNNSRNPIQHFKSRIKTPSSIGNKMRRKNLPLNYDVMRNEILDIAGVRVICSYIEDIYLIADMIMKQDNIITIRKKDYIASPKPNGYRSLHLVVKVPIYLSGEKQMIPVEIQMRTLAMDFWACLDHQLRYKSSLDVPSTIRSRLAFLANNMYDADMEMQQIYKELQNYKLE